MDEIDLASTPNCRAHPGRDAVDRCASCDAPMCGECTTIFDGLDLCPTCAEDRRKGLERNLAEAEAELTRIETTLRSYAGAVTDAGFGDFNERREALAARIARIRRTLGLSS